MSEVRNEMMKRILSGKIVQAPTACYKAEPNGMVSDELIEFYTPRAENPVRTGIATPDFVGNSRCGRRTFSSCESYQRQW